VVAENDGGEVNWLILTRLQSRICLHSYIWPCDGQLFWYKRPHAPIDTSCGLAIFILSAGLSLVVHQGDLKQLQITPALRQEWIYI
jgi:hypothetical protein